MFRSLKRSDPAQQRGVIILLLALSLIVIFVVASWAIGRDYLNYKRMYEQRAADMAALSGAYMIENDGSSPSPTQITTATTESGTIATYNGYTADSQTTVTVTYPYESNYNLYQVQIDRQEPIFFGAIVGHPTATVQAIATATFFSDQPMQVNASGYGRINQDFNYAAYGPQNGTDRGDDIDTEFESITSGDPGNGKANAYFGLNSGSTTYGPTDYPYGSVYSFNVPSTYKTATGTSLIDFEIYDPDTYDNTVNAHGQYDETGKAPSGSNSNAEMWLYTLWKGGPPGSSTASVVAQAVYGENTSSNSYGNTDDLNTNDHWVTPSSTPNSSIVGNWSFDTSSDFSSSTDTNPDGSVTYYLSVQTTNGTKVSGQFATGTTASYGTGYDENGYLLRAGPPHTAMSSASLSQSTSQALTTTTTYTSQSTLKARTDLMDPYATDTSKSETYDAEWNSSYGASVSGIQMDVLTEASVNCNSTSGGAVNIYFGYAPPAPNDDFPITITFKGWDEDSGATKITYTCDEFPGTTWTGVLGGNEEWSPTTTSDTYPSLTPAANVIIFPAGTYTGGNWTAQYTTGATDNTTWEWSDTGQKNGQDSAVFLTYTQSNVF